MMELVFENRGTGLEWHALDADGDTSGDGRVLMTATLPLTEIVTDFFDKLKSRSSGFASFEFVLVSPPVRFCTLIDSRACFAATRMPATRRATCARCVGRAAVRDSTRR